VPLLDVATAFTVKNPDFPNIWLTLFPLSTTSLVQSPKSHSILEIFQSVNGTNLTLVGNHELIASTLIKKLNHKSPQAIGVTSDLSSHKEIMTRLLSSTIHIGFLLQSQSISSSHTFQILSPSKSY
jgi:hypothetical protein